MCLFYKWHYKNTPYIQIVQGCDVIPGPPVRDGTNGRDGMKGDKGEQGPQRLPWTRNEDVVFKNGGEPLVLQLTTNRNFITVEGESWWKWSCSIWKWSWLHCLPD